MDTAAVRLAKAKLRQTIRTAVQGLDPDRKRRDSAQAQARLLQQPVWRNAQSILGFAPLPEEVDIWPTLAEALQQGKQVALPFYEKPSRCYQARWVQNLGRDIKTGWAGIREPADDCAPAELNKLDLALVPGVGFDPYGRRLGRGKGFYDRLLLAVGGLKCGVGWDVQVCPQVPAEPHDIKLDCILTPTQWLVAGHESV